VHYLRYVIWASLTALLIWSAFSVVKNFNELNGLEAHKSVITSAKKTPAEPVRQIQQPTVEPVDRLTQLYVIALGSDRERANAAMRELAKINSEASVEKLIQLMKDIPPGAGLYDLLDSISALHDPKLTGFVFQKYLGEQNDAAKRLVVEMFRNVADPSSLQQLIDTTEGLEPQREKLVELIGYFQEPRMIEPFDLLITTSPEPYDSLAVAAIHSLAATPDNRAIDVLLQHATSSNDPSFAEAIKSISWQGAELELQASAQLTTTAVYPRILAIQALANFPLPSVGDTLRALEADPNEQITVAAREAYAQAFGAAK
jgi:HEAT repeat protein